MATTSLQGDNSPGPSLRRLRAKMLKLPGGKTLFNRLIGFAAPYTGSIKPHVRTLEPGHAVVEIRDTRAVRNHLGSIHAIALANIGEATTGMAMTAGLVDGARVILKRLSIDYLIKARGTLTAECRVDVPQDRERREVIAEAIIRDDKGQEVARVEAVWLMGPCRGKSSS